MRIRHFSDYEAMSAEAAQLFLQAVTGPDTSTACLATGHSPLGLYRNLTASKAHLSHLNIVKLDEWLGLPMEHPGSCETYLRNEVLAPWGIPDAQFSGFHSNPPDTRAECQRMQGELQRLGPFNVCVLGIGKNGHLAMNEPAASLQPHCHRAQLAPGTQQHAMLAGSHITVTEGLTLGMADLLNSRLILLLVSGPGKEAAFQRLLTCEITTELPASFLWLHPNVEVLVEGMQ